MKFIHGLQLAFKKTGKNPKGINLDLTGNAVCIRRSSTLEPKRNL
jgi:hypothetical protein